MAGLDGDWQDYMISFLKKDCKVTAKEVVEYAENLGKNPPYTIEDTYAVLEKARWYWEDIPYKTEDEE